MEGPAKVPRISVVLPTYNRASLVGEAIESVLSQDYPDVELLVVDDGSTDGTVEAVRRRFGDDPRVAVHRQEHAGPARARNRAIDLATGDLVSFLDSDDSYLPGFLSAHAAALRAAPAAAMSVCDALYEGPWPRRGPTMFERIRHGLPKSLEDICRGGWLLVTCLMIRAPVIRALRFDPQWYAEDTEMLCRFFLAGHTYVVEPRPLTVYRKHGGRESEPQRIDRAEHARAEAVRLRSAYYARCRFPRRRRGALRREWAKELWALRRYEEARPHLWAWWGHRPFQWKAPWMLLRSARGSR